MDYRDEMSDEELERRKLLVKFCAVAIFALFVSNLFRESAHERVPEGTICPDGNPAISYNPARGQYTDDWMVNEPMPYHVCLRVD